MKNLINGFLILCFVCGILLMAYGAAMYLWLLIASTNIIVRCVGLVVSGGLVSFIAAAVLRARASKKKEITHAADLFN